MCDFEIINDNGAIDIITCKNRTEAIETYCLIYGYPKEYVKEHCIIRHSNLLMPTKCLKTKGSK